jgi:hypothetical protein
MTTRSLTLIQDHIEGYSASEAIRWALRLAQDRIIEERKEADRKAKR